MDRRDQSQLEAFLEMLAAERGAARNTLAAYARDVDDFAQWLAPKGTRVIDASADDIRAYLAGLGDVGLAARTQARRLSALRQFYRFLYGEGVRGDDPSQTVDRPRQGRSLPKLLSEDEVDRLLDAARDRDGRKGPGCMRWWNFSMRPACGFPNWSACPWARLVAIRAFWSSRARAARNGWCH